MVANIDLEYPIRFHSKVKWSRATFTKHDNGMVTAEMPRGIPSKAGDDVILGVR